LQHKTPTVTPSTSPAIKKPVRKAPPPPVLPYKSPQVNGDTSREHRSESPAISKEPKPIVNSTSEAQFQQRQKHQQPLLLQQKGGSSQDHSPLAQEKDSIQDQQQQQQQNPAAVKHISKSSSCSEIVNAQGKRVPPPPPVRDSSLTAESFDELGTDKGDDTTSSSQDPRQSRASKPVPKRRTKSVYH